MEQGLNDIKVIDLTWYISGPYATKLLADYGAEVIKIEKPGTGDPARTFPPFLNDEPHSEKSGLFLHLNTNKQGITLNLKSEEGKQIVLRLVESADILVESFSPGVMDRLGLGYHVMEKVNPELVMVSISNFGQTGPCRDYKASELTLNAFATSMKPSGNSEREPLKMGGRVVQYQAGSLASVATMSGLMASKIQGIGQHIDVSITEELLTIIDRRGPWLLASQYTGDIDKRLPPGTSLVGGSPDGIYPCKDGYWDLIGGVMWWPNIFKMLGEPPELADPRYGTAEWQQDPERQAEILSVFMPWSLSHTKEDATNAALEARECAAPLYTVADLLTNPHLEDRGYFVEIDHPVAGTLKYTGAPFSPDKSPWQVRRPAPLLGEHNSEVLGSLGYSKQDITRMRSSGII